MRRAALITAGAVTLASARDAPAQPGDPAGDALRGIDVTYADAPGRGTGTPTLRLLAGDACARAAARDDVEVTSTGELREGFTLCLLATPRRGVAFAHAVVHVVAAAREDADCAVGPAGPGSPWLTPTTPAPAVHWRDEDGVRFAAGERADPGDAAPRASSFARALARWWQGWRHPPNRCVRASRAARCWRGRATTTAGCASRSFTSPGRACQRATGRAAWRAGVCW
ncbi:MAG: hypothetical protein U0325_13610 [Polyangiales bacterium]